MMNLELKGKVAVVTGGSRGIGREIAVKFAELGADIAILYVGSEDLANESCKMIEEKGVKAKSYFCDVSNLEQSQEISKKVLDDFGTVDILVNNAGITRDGLMISMSEEDYDAVLDINLKGAFNMTKVFYRTFMRKKAGKIINITSISGIMGNKGQTNYSASKAGLIGLTKSVARELAVKNVNCNAIAPGFIQTDMTEEIKGDNPLLSSTPMKKMGTPADIANAAAFLAGPYSDYITGEVLKVDGGLAM